MSQTGLLAPPEQSQARGEPVNPLQRLKFTPEMFHRLGELGFFDDATRYELIEGDIYPMTPEGPEHAFAGTALQYRFTQPTADWHVRVERPLILGESEVIPDVSIVAGRPLDYRTQHPTSALLVIEVAHTSLPRDRSLKYRVYARAGIPEYWIVNLFEKQLEVYREPQGELYKSVRYYTVGEAVAPLFAPDLQVSLDELFG